MASYNKVLLLGNLTRDPEVRYTPKGTAIANIGLAVNRTYTTEGGEQKEEVTFIDIEVWGRQAETVGQYLAKGRPVFVEGRLKLDSWEDKESGQKRNKLKVVAERVQFLGAPWTMTSYAHLLGAVRDGTVVYPVGLPRRPLRRGRRCLRRRPSGCRLNR